MKPTGGGHSALRLFLGFAAASLVPVVLLGLLLAASYMTEADRRGLIEGRALAALFATTTVEPLLDDTDLRTGLPQSTGIALRRAIAAPTADGSVLRLRLRDLDGRIVFSDDGVGEGELSVDHEAMEAANGQIGAHLTRLHSDASSTGPSGQRAIEIYRPLTGGETDTRVGVLEVYLPYAPIERDISQGLDMLYRNLAGGLAILYVVLAGVSIVTTRQLRLQSRDNAYLAEHDPLTGLVNRRVFEQNLATIGGGAAARAAVAVIDLDRFKEVNDTIGHRGGDEMIVLLAARLASAMGSGDLVARLGGDEFGVVLLGVTTEHDAKSALEALRALLSEPMQIAGVPLNAESSIGYVLAPHDGDHLELLQRAEIAMYTAKARHCGVLRYEAAHDHYDSDRLALVSELRRALENDELVLHYQPQLHLAEDEVRTVEALLRWHHPRHGLLYPDDFLPAAEQTGLIDRLTDWVLVQALRQVREWDATGGRVDVAVNVSARNLTSPAFAARTLAILRSSGLGPERLLLEVTETAVFTDVEAAMRELNLLKGANIRISLDDFGQGQTSLAHLARLPITELKVDRAFVTAMTANASNAAIVRSVIDLAHNLGMSVVAEGVEDPQTLQALRSWGCDVAQGYLVCRPMPADGLISWLTAQQQRAWVG